jgi:hypothetical protein
LVTVVDPSQSTSLTVIEKGAFNITYVTPNSGVTGDYIADNFAIGGTTIQNLTMAVATNAAYVATGIMGIGFDTDESIASGGGKPYPNIIDVMVQQNIIKTRAYSLWLDDLGMFISNTSWKSSFLCLQVISTNNSHKRTLPEQFYSAVMTPANTQASLRY